MTSGYSGTPLPTKLGIKVGSRVLLHGRPPGFDLGPLDAVVHNRRRRSPYDVGVLFAKDLAQLAQGWPMMHAAVTPAGRLWVAWPKRASCVPSDLDDDVVRRHGLDHGRVDVMVCAIDEIWSGQCFVVRLIDR